MSRECVEKQNQEEMITFFLNGWPLRIQRLGTHGGEWRDWLPSTQLRDPPHSLFSVLLYRVSTTFVGSGRTSPPLLEDEFLKKIKSVSRRPRFDPENYSQVQWSWSCLLNLIPRKKAVKKVWQTHFFSLHWFSSFNVSFCSLPSLKVSSECTRGRFGPGPRVENTTTKFDRDRGFLLSNPQQSWTSSR